VRRKGKEEKGGRTGGIGVAVRMASREEEKKEKKRGKKRNRRKKKRCLTARSSKKKKGGARVLKRGEGAENGGAYCLEERKG